MERNIYTSGVLRVGQGLICSIVLLVGAVGTFLGNKETINTYLQSKSAKPKVSISERENRIQASINLSGYFPTRGFDYNKDGLLDKVERFEHGAPRIPFGAWHSVDLNDSLAKKLQQEYQGYLKDQSKFG